MEGVCLTFYMDEFKKHHGKLMYEWIIEFAKKNGIQGGSVFKTIAGYGRHGKFHEEHFFELASETSVKIEFFLPEEKVRKLIELLKTEHPDLFYSISPSKFGTVSDMNSVL